MKLESKLGKVILDSQVGAYYCGIKVGHTWLSQLICGLRSKLLSLLISSNPLPPRLTGCGCDQGHVYPSPVTNTLHRLEHRYLHALYK